MTSVLILLSGFDPGTYFIEDDGIPNNGIAQLRGPDGGIITFNIPTEFLTVTASAGRSVIFNLTESFGAADINVGNLTNSAENPDSIQIESIAGAGDVLLVANQSITEVGADAAPDIVASTLILSAGTGVGTPGNALETQVLTIEAETTTGGISVTNNGNVTIGGLTDNVVGLDVDTSGDILFTSFGSIVLAEQSPGGFESIHGGTTSGNVSLIANGFDSDITSSVDQDAIAAAGGNILLQAGRDISLGTLGLNFDNDVRARGSLTLIAGRDVNVDGFADLASDGFGAATGGNLLVSAGRDVNILNSTGTDGSLGAEGSGGADVFLSTGPGGFLRLLAGSSASLFSSTGDVNVNADRIVISATSGITASGGVITLATASPGWNINLGSVTDGAFAMELSDAELDRIFTPNLIVGSNNGGFVTISSAISPASAADLVIRSGVNINVNASVTTIGSLSLRAFDNVFQLAASVITTPSLTVFVDSTDDDPGVGGDATLNGTISGTNVVTGNLDGDDLSGSSSGETLLGLGGEDRLFGFGGNDILDGGSSVDNMIGGLGNDTFKVDNNNDTVTEAIGEGDDSVIATISYALVAGTEIETIGTSNAAGTATITLVGNDFAQSIFGNAGTNLLQGLGGNDNLVGGGGNDTLDGGTGADVLRGGAGNDTMIVDNLGDQVFENVGEGDDVVIANANYVLNAGAEIETLTTAIAGAVNITGNEFGQSIFGNAGVNVLNGGGGNDQLLGFGDNDTLIGGTGADVMRGHGGNDSYNVDNAGDLVFENVGEGDDTVLASVNYTLASGVEVETMGTTNAAGIGAINLTGNDFGQSIFGNNGANVLNGDGGGDSLNGLDGNDVLNGGSGNDVLTGGLGADEHRFTTNLNAATNVDTIVGYTPGVDGIALDDAVFTALALGTLPASAFRIGASALDADDRIIYNNATGQLFYDADGTGAGAQIQFATLQGAPAITSNDFAVI